MAIGGTLITLTTLEYILYCSHGETTIEAADEKALEKEEAADEKALEKEENFFPLEDSFPVDEDECEEDGSLINEEMCNVSDDVIRQTIAEAQTRNISKSKVEKARVKRFVKL